MCVEPPEPRDPKEPGALLSWSERVSRTFYSYTSDAPADNTYPAKQGGSDAE